MDLKPPYPSGAQCSLAEDCLQVSFSIPEDDPYLDGHFPGNPLVPAIAQMGWLTAGVEALRGAPLGAHRMARFKFLRPIRPNESVSVHIQIAAPKYSLRVFVDGELCSSGTLTVEADDV